VNRILRRYVPGHFRQPWRLAGRLLKTRDPAAIYAMSLAAAGVAVSPLDFCLSLLEPRGNDEAEPATGPLLFVCGGPRVGTTLVCQTLVRHLPVSHFTNLTSLFPAAPLTATRLFARFLSEPVSEYRSFYGRTTRLSGLNDALYLWDRWLGADRLDASPTLESSAADEMRRFFAAWRELTGRPLAAKCNRLNAAAHLVAETLPEATFICVEREPAWHAQSLLQARKMINGAVDSPYGLTSPVAADGDDPIAGVVEQVQFHAKLAAAQEERIGRDRFWRVSYEDFCREPATLVKRAAEVLWKDQDRPAIDREIQPHRAANRRTLDAETFAKIEELLSAGQLPTN
jgi:hypothetical protein